MELKVICQQGCFIDKYVSVCMHECVCVCVYIPLFRVALSTLSSSSEMISDTAASDGKTSSRRSSRIPSTIILDVTRMRDRGPTSNSNVSKSLFN